MDGNARIHAQIQDFLHKQTIATLAPGAAGLPTDHYIKAGVVPYVRQQPMLFQFMKPVPKRPGLGVPDFQLCKGTRMYYQDGQGWIDLRDGQDAPGQKETLIATALREGVEELGLKLSAIIRLLDMGPYNFASVRSGRQRQMWLYAAEMPSVDDVLPMEEVAPTTAERGWLSQAEFVVVGREDHRYILSDIAAKLAAHHKE